MWYRNCVGLEHKMDVRCFNLLEFTYWIFSISAHCEYANCRVKTGNLVHVSSGFLRYSSPLLKQITYKYIHTDISDVRVHDFVYRFECV